MRLDRRHHLLGDLVEHGEHIAQLAVVPLGPDVLAGLGLDQLAADPDTFACGAHAALEHIAHAKLARDLPHVDRAALVDEARIAGDDEQPAQPRERRDDVLGDAVGEVVLLGIAREVGERQDRNRRPGWRGERLSGARRGRRGSGVRLLAQLQAGVALDDHQRALGEQAGQQLVDRGFPELGLMGELLARDALPRQIIPDLGRDPLLVVHHRPAPAPALGRAGLPERTGKLRR